MPRWSPHALCGTVLLGTLATGAVPGLAGPIPDPNQSNIPDQVTITPDGAFEFAAQISGEGYPVPGATVVVTFSPDATHLIAWSDGFGDAPSHLETAAEPYREYTGVTDANGEVGFHIAGGGCIQWNAYQGQSYIVQVRADNIILAEPAVNSPDVVNDTDGKLCTETGTCNEVGGVTSVSAADASYHAPNLGLGLADPCTDFTAPYGDGTSGADATILGPYIKFAIGSPAHCGP